MKKFTKVCLMIAAVMGGVGILLCGIVGAAGMRSKPGEVKQALEETGVYDDEDGFHIGFTDNWLGKLITQAVKIKNSDRYQISELERGTVGGHGGYYPKDGRRNGQSDRFHGVWI